MSENSSNFPQIDNTSLVTSIAFINICLVLIFYFRGSNPPFGEETCGIMITAVTVIYVLFLISATFTYADMITKSYTEIREIGTIKSISYIIGMIGFCLVTITLLVQI